MIDPKPSNVICFKNKIVKELNWNKNFTSSSFLDTAFLVIFQRIRSEQPPLPLPCPIKYRHRTNKSLRSGGAGPYQYSTGLCRYSTICTDRHISLVWVGPRMSVPVRFGTHLVCVGRCRFGPNSLKDSKKCWISLKKASQWFKRLHSWIMGRIKNPRDKIKIVLKSLYQFHSKEIKTLPTWWQLYFHEIKQEIFNILVT